MNRNNPRISLVATDFSSPRLCFEICAHKLLNILCIFHKAYSFSSNSLKLWYNHHSHTPSEGAVPTGMMRKTNKVSPLKRGHRPIAAVRSNGDKSKAVGAPGHHKPGEKTKGQSALATAVAEDELEERRRLFAKARKGDKGAVAKIYELYGARIYTSAQVKEVKPTSFGNSVVPFRKRAHRG